MRSLRTTSATLPKSTASLSAANFVQRHPGSILQIFNTIQKMRSLSEQQWQPNTYVELTCHCAIHRHFYRNQNSQFQCRKFRSKIFGLNFANLQHHTKCEHFQNSIDKQHLWDINATIAKYIDTPSKIITVSSSAANVFQRYPNSILHIFDIMQQYEYFQNIFDSRYLWEINATIAEYIGTPSNIDIARASSSVANFGRTYPDWIPQIVNIIYNMRTFPEQH